jgi:hypothetical protein
MRKPGRASIHAPIDLGVLHGKEDAAKQAAG